MIVARKGFQSGCEETAKRADIALVPPITGSVEWLNGLTEDEVLDRVADAVKIFTLGDAWRRDPSSYRTGDVSIRFTLEHGDPRDAGHHTYPPTRRVGKTDERLY